MYMKAALRGSGLVWSFTTLQNLQKPWKEVSVWLRSCSICFLIPIFPVLFFYLTSIWFLPPVFIPIFSVALLECLLLTPSPESRLFVVHLLYIVARCIPLPVMYFTICLQLPVVKLNIRQLLWQCEFIIVIHHIEPFFFSEMLLFGDETEFLQSVSSRNYTRLFNILTCRYLMPGCWDSALKSCGGHFMIELTQRGIWQCLGGTSLYEQSIVRSWCWQIDTTNM